jgi:hypothetical protein
MQCQNIYTGQPKGTLQYSSQLNVELDKLNKLSLMINDQFLDLGQQI